MRTMPEGEGRDETRGVFLRNIPSKCDLQTLSNFLLAKGLTDFEIEMARFPDGKSRGYAVIRCCEQSAVRKLVDSVHSQFVPGFQKRTPLFCERLLGKGPRRCQSAGFVPVSGGASSGSEMKAASNIAATQAASVGASEMVPHGASKGSIILDDQPACTTVFNADGKLSFFL